MVYYCRSYAAAIYWKIPFYEVVLGRGFTDKDPIDITVTSLRERYKRKGHKVYLCTTYLPEGAVKYDEYEGFWVSSPELVFLEFANELDILRLILLGMLLCSHPVNQPGNALTTKEKIETLVKKARWHRGRRKALRAIKYVENGASSVMEALVYMALRLPHALGGYAIKGITLNQCVQLEEKAIALLKQHKCFADLYLAAKELAIEYQSDEYHSSPEAKAWDKKRISALESQGIKVIEINKNTLYSFRRLQETVEDIYRTIDKRLNIRTRKFLKMHFHLRSLFPRLETTETST